MFRDELVLWPCLFRRTVCGWHDGDPNDRCLKPFLESSVASEHFPEAAVPVIAYQLESLAGYVCNCTRRALRRKG